MKILQIFNHTRWRFAKKVNFFAYLCAGAQEWAPEQFDKIKVKLLWLVAEMMAAQMIENIHKMDIFNREMI